MEHKEQGISVFVLNNEMVVMNSSDKWNEDYLKEFIPSLLKCDLKNIYLLQFYKNFFMLLK